VSGGIPKESLAGRRRLERALEERLRAETTMTVSWIAERLEKGTRGHLNHLLYRQRKAGGE